MVFRNYLLNNQLKSCFLNRDSFFLVGLYSDVNTASYHAGIISKHSPHTFTSDCSMRAGCCKIKHSLLFLPAFPTKGHSRVWAQIQLFLEQSVKNCSTQLTSGNWGYCSSCPTTDKWKHTFHKLPRQVSCPSNWFSWCLAWPTGNHIQCGYFMSADSFAPSELFQQTKTRDISH